MQIIKCQVAYSISYYHFSDVNNISCSEHVNVNGTWINVMIIMETGSIKTLMFCQQHMVPQKAFGLNDFEYS